MPPPSLSPQSIDNLNVGRLPPAPPTYPPPAAESTFFSFAFVAGFFIGAIILAVVALFMQWFMCVYLIPYAKYELRAAEQRQAQREQAAAERHEQYREQERLAQLAPAPRVRALAWTGTDLVAANSNLPKILPPPLHDNSRPRSSSSAKVAPTTISSLSSLRRPAHRDSTPWPVWRVLQSPFCLMQTALNCILSFVFTFGIFFLLLSFEPGPFELEDPMVLILLFLSPFAVSIFSPIAIPMLMPEMMEKGWLGYVRVMDLPSFMWCLPFLRAPTALQRHALLSVFVAALWIPLGLFLLSHVITPPYNRLVVCIFGGAYNLTISAAVMPMAILGFTIKDNYDRAIGMMSMHPDWRWRLVQRGCNIAFA